MSRSIIWGIVRFLVLLCTQVLVLDNINLFGYVEPMLYIWFILLLPIKTPKWLVLILSFLMGFCVDIFAGQVGFHTAVSTFTGFLRPIFFSQINADNQFSAFDIPSSETMGFMPYIAYISVLTFVHIFAIVMIETFRWSEILQILLSAGLSSVVTILLIILCDTMFFRNSKD